MRKREVKPGVFVRVKENARKALLDSLDSLVKDSLVKAFRVTVYWYLKRVGHVGKIVSSDPEEEYAVVIFPRSKKRYIFFFRELELERFW